MYVYEKENPKGIKIYKNKKKCENNANYVHMYLYIYVSMYRVVVYRRKRIS